VKGEIYVTPIREEHIRMLIKILPIMVTSHLFHLYGLIPKEMDVEGDYLFDFGGYFLLEGMKRISWKEDSLQYFHNGHVSLTNINP
jgi:hypothetical protein